MVLGVIHFLCSSSLSCWDTSVHCSRPPCPRVQSTQTGLSGRLLSNTPRPWTFLRLPPLRTSFFQFEFAFYLSQKFSGGRCWGRLSVRCGISAWEDGGEVGDAGKAEWNEGPTEPWPPSGGLGGPGLRPVPLGPGGPQPHLPCASQAASWARARALLLLRGLRGPQPAQGAPGRGVDNGCESQADDPMPSQLLLWLHVSTTLGKRLCAQ